MINIDFNSLYIYYIYNREIELLRDTRIIIGNLYISSFIDNTSLYYSNQEFLNSFTKYIIIKINIDNKSFLKYINKI